MAGASASTLASFSCALSWKRAATRAIGSIRFSRPCQSLVKALRSQSRCPRIDRAGDADDVETARRRRALAQAHQIVLCGQQYAAAFGRGDRLGGAAEGRTAPAAHFHEHQLRAVTGDQIDLAAGDAVIARQDVQTLRRRGAPRPGLRPPGRAAGAARRCSRRFAGRQRHRHAAAEPGAAEHAPVQGAIGVHAQARRSGRRAGHPRVCPRRSSRPDARRRRRPAPPGAAVRDPAAARPGAPRPGARRRRPRSARLSAHGLSQNTTFSRSASAAGSGLPVHTCEVVSTGRPNTPT